MILRFVIGKNEQKLRSQIILKNQDKRIYEELLKMYHGT